MLYEEGTKSPLRGSLVVINALTKVCISIQYFEALVAVRCDNKQNFYVCKYYLKRAQALQNSNSFNWFYIVEPFVVLFKNVPSKTSESITNAAFLSAFSKSDNWQCKKCDRATENIHSLYHFNLFGSREWLLNRNCMISWQKHNHIASLV